MEILVAIGLLAVLLVVYSMMLQGTVLLRASRNYVQAADFIQEELDALRSLKSSDLLARTNGHFLNIPIQRGDWRVMNVNGDGQNQRLVLSSPPAAVGDETGLVIVPGNYREDFTFSAKVKVDAASPVGFGAGIVFRYRDSENFYRLRFTSGGLALDKVYQGASTLLQSWGPTYSCSTSWCTLTVIVNGNSITCKKDGTALSPVTTDMTFTTGDLGLMSVNSAIVSFDDVSVTENSTTTDWNFESYAANGTPDEWRRMSYLDLPGGTGTLTIANYLGETKMIQATVNITWQDGGRTRSVSGSTVYGN